MRYLKYIALTLLLAGCARAATEDTDAYEQTALDAWMAKYAPEATKMDNGGYYEVLTKPEAGAEKIEAGKWVVLSYIVKDLEGNIVLTRSEAIARQQGTFTKYTHYVPDYAFLMEKNNTTMIEGQYINLLDMHVGEVRKLYLPSKLGYGSSTLSNAAGYGGQYSLSGSRPFIVDSLRVIEIVDDAQQRDYDQVDSVALSWGMNLVDSVKNHLYLKKLHNAGTLADSVAADSTARIYYVGHFLDGFVFDTNIDSIRRRVYGEIRQKSDTAALEFVRSKANTLPAAVFVAPSEKFIYGDSIRMVVSSYYAYGIAGRTGYYVETTYEYSPYTSGYGYGYGSYGDYYGSSYYSGYYGYQNTSSTVVLRTEILPYTPLIYEFVVLKKEE